MWYFYVNLGVTLFIFFIMVKVVNILEIIDSMTIVEYNNYSLPNQKRVVFKLYFYDLSSVFLSCFTRIDIDAQ